MVSCKRIAIRYKGILLAAFMLVSLLILAIDHRGNSLGDALFKSIGIPPWSDPKNNQGFHFSANTGFILLIISGQLAIGHFRKKYSKAGRVIVLICILFLYLFPVISEKFMYLIHYNQTGIAVIDYKKKDSGCDFQSENGTVTFHCNLSLMNYGKRFESVMIRPVFHDHFIGRELSAVDIAFQEILLPPHSSGNYSVTYTGKLEHVDSINGTTSQVGIEIVKDGLHKTIQ